MFAKFVVPDFFDKMNGGDFVFRSVPEGKFYVFPGFTCVIVQITL